MARVEWMLVTSSLRWTLTLLLVALIPSIYLLIYLSSIWDPAAHSQSLQVGLVNLDKGHAYRNQTVNIGTELTNRLFQKKTFGFIHLPDAEMARTAVRKGDLAFAVVIPSDFSALALPGIMANEGHLEGYTSAGNNYQTHLMAKKFAEELDSELNETLNQQRWKFVLYSPSMNEDWRQLRSALEQIHKGSKELSAGLTDAYRASNRMQTGSQRLSEEVVKFSASSQQIASVLRTMESSLPVADDLRRLRIGSEDLANGQAELDKGLNNLNAGSQKLLTGLKDFRQNQENLFWGMARLSEWIDPLESGLIDLNTGLQRVQMGQAPLKAGSEQVRDGVRALVFGVRDLRMGLRQTIEKFPDNQQLGLLGVHSQELASAQKQLDVGLKQLQEGGVYLNSSLDWMIKKLPNEIRFIEGSPEGLAHSVSSDIHVAAPVSRLGVAMIPNVLPLAIWLGAGIAIFLIRSRHLPRFAERYSNFSKLLAKATIPMMVVSAQAIAMMMLLQFWFNAEVAHVLPMMMMMVVTANAFVFVFMLFVQIGGDLGKAVAMLFLALQMSASGGVLPVELSGSFYASLSPFLPMTWVVQGLKAAQFGAFDGNWHHPFLLMVLMGLTSAGLGMLLSRWHYAPIHQLRPQLDL